MRILLTNDDGIHAPGFAVLESIAAKLSDDVWAVAPAEEQSGAGHSLTLSRPIRLRRHGPRKYSVSGTPTDAVMMALAHIMKDSPPDLILSGVNSGRQPGRGRHLFGNRVRRHGRSAGRRPVDCIEPGLCPRRHGRHGPLCGSRGVGGARYSSPCRAPFAPGTLVNVNFPALAPEAVKGIRICRQGIRDYGRLRIVERTDPRGYKYYWFGLAPTVETPGHVTDLEVVADGYISVTPLFLDLTHEPGLDELAGRFKDQA